MNKSNSTTVFCPVCGTEFSIAEHEHTVNNATVIGKDSNLGNIPLPVDKVGKMGKADERLAALKAAGVDTSNLFAMQSASGEGMMVRIKNGVPEMVGDDDPIYKVIIGNGTIPERRLFRRWIMAQMFALLTMRSYRNDRPMPINDAIRRHGSEYQWKMVLEELRVQSILAEKDRENYYMRYKWFNTKVCTAMVNEYVAGLTMHIRFLKEHKCKGVPYKKLGSKNVFVSDIEGKVIIPLKRAALEVANAYGPKMLYRKMLDFDRIRRQYDCGSIFSKTWIDAYKGAGAYFTMRNLIMFHGCGIHGERSQEVFTKETSLRLLDERASEYMGEGWRMFAMMKKLIKDNGIDIEAKRQEWREAKK